MAEIVKRFTRSLQAPDGHAYTPRACGREREDGTWEGWIEFLPDDGRPVLRSRRETTQPNRQDLEYWASGLTVTYLEGALARTLEPERPAVGTVEPRPAYEHPAPEHPVHGGTDRPRPHTVLDPYAVYARSGESVLRRELAALSADHLRDIILAYRLHAGEPAATERATLAELIVAAVRRASG